MYPGEATAALRKSLLEFRMAQPAPMNQHDEARTALQRWVSQFAPLVMDEGPLDASALRDRLTRVEKLKAELPRVKDQKIFLSLTDDGELLRTFSMAQDQLHGLENDLRKQLSHQAPGDPESIADLGLLQDRLAERAARVEMGANEVVPEILELETSPRQIGTGIGIGIFGLGWTAFTTVHCVLMIGGMWKAMGPVALFMLLFYAIFFGVGGLMLAGAFYSFCDESISLDGFELTIRRKLLSFTWESKKTLDPKLRAQIHTQTSTDSDSGRQSHTKSIQMTDINGKEIKLAMGATEAKRQQIVNQINAYLSVQRGD